MKHTLLLFATALLLGIQSFAQTGVAINATGAEPDNSAMLDVSASNKGMLVPRMTDIQRTAITNPAKGLLVYQNDGTEGFYYFDGTVWIRLTGGTYTETDPVVIAINGIVKSNGTTISSAIDGIDYLTPTGSAFKLINFPILNQNTTGNAATATTATSLAGGGPGHIPYQSATGTTSMLTAGTPGQVLTSGGSGAPSWHTPATGTVTSVALSLPSIFSVSGSPITTSGTLTGTLSSQTANTFFAAPNGSSGLPGFRSLVSSDIPSLSSLYINNSTSQQLSSNFNISGTGVIGNSLTTPLLLGGSVNTSSITYKTTSGLGTTGADHIFKVGNNGATEAMRILNNGNIGVGTASPHNSSILELNSTNRGLLVPRMTAVQRTNISAPAMGLIVYQNDGISGFYYFDGSAWTMLDSFWKLNGNDISYSAGKVGIGVDSPENVGTAPLNVQGGILYKGGQTGADTPGLLYYDPGSGNGVFKYRDNTTAEQVLGTGSINYSGTLWSNISSDYVASPDVLCQSHLAVGTDVTPGENLNFISILLKANNLRIRFDDSSDVPGFPANDWQLLANDISSGGSNYFAIEDLTSAKVPFKLMAGAPTNSLLVNALGNTGFGTSLPARKVHIMDAMRLEPTIEPADAGAGDLYFDSTTNKLRCFDGTAWHDLW